MSHFTVLVIGENPEDQLQPFDENKQVPEYKDSVVPEEELKKFTEVYTTFVPERGYGAKSEEEAEENKKLSFEDLYEKRGDDWNGNEWRKDENGEWAAYSTYNPDSKWDWYVLGGRWTGAFILKKDKAGEGTLGEISALCSDDYKQEHSKWKEGRLIVDQAYKGDIDWEAMLKNDVEVAEKQWKEIEKMLKEDDKTVYIRYGIDEKTTKESYIQNCTGFYTFALLKDGKWYERGKMGWFAIVQDEKDRDQWKEEFKKLIDELPDDTLLSVYDCHI